MEHDSPSGKTGAPRGQDKCGSCTCSSFLLLWDLLPFVPSSLATKRFLITSLGSNCEPSLTSRKAGLFIQQIFNASLPRGDGLLREGEDFTSHMLLAWRQALRSHCCPHLRLMNIPYLLSVPPIPFHRRGNVMDDVALHKPPWDSFLGGDPPSKIQHLWTFGGWTWQCLRPKCLAGSYPRDFP